jgi:hypothetical protein
MKSLPVLIESKWLRCSMNPFWPFYWHCETLNKTYERVSMISGTGAAICTAVVMAWWNGWW